MSENTTSATSCRHAPHHCPGCGKVIDCDYVCCATCTPPQPVNYPAELARLTAALAEVKREHERELGCLRAEQEAEVAAAVAAFAERAAKVCSENCQGRAVTLPDEIRALPADRSHLDRMLAERWTAGYDHAMREQEPNRQNDNIAAAIRARGTHE